MLSKVRKNQMFNLRFTYNVGTRHVLVATLSQQQFFMATMNCCNNFIATITTITTILKIHFLVFRWEVLWFSEQTFCFGHFSKSLFSKSAQKWPLFRVILKMGAFRSWTFSNTGLWKDFQMTEWMISVLAKIFMKTLKQN